MSPTESSEERASDRGRKTAPSPTESSEERASDRGRKTAPSPIVIGYSPDEFGKAAVERGLEEARLRESSLVIVNGSRGEAPVDPRFASRNQLAELTDLLKQEGVPFEVRQMVGFDVAEQVLDAAESVQAEMVVLGIRRRTPVGKLLMGSVAQKVILGAHCAVLAVKP